MGLAIPLKQMGIGYAFTTNCLQGNPFANRYTKSLRYKFLLQKATLRQHQSCKKVIFETCKYNCFFFYFFYCFSFFCIIALLLFRAVEMIVCLCFFPLFSFVVPYREQLLFPKGNKTFSYVFFCCSLQGIAVAPFREQLLFPKGNITFSCVFFCCSLQGTTHFHVFSFAVP